MASNLNLTVEEYDLLADPKYRSYVSAIDKTLKHFESTSEWADLISALGKLNKVLTSHADRPVIPRRILISKRLAQCMHPALPGGVHLKALETYDIIFRCIGMARLSRELFIYSAGLFPLLANAAMNVRPALLNIYEIHFVPLGERLRPGLPGFLNGVLPGLEEGSEYFEKTNVVLEKVCAGVGNTCFYGCLWECVLANPSVRLSAVTYVFNHFNRRLTTEDQIHVIGTNVDIMVKALSSAVIDSSVLVQRCTLDFVLVAFPFHSGYLIRKDMERILTSAVSVVLRRDMSLNRRLYSWLLGSDDQQSLPDPSRFHRSVSDSGSTDATSPAASFFEMYSKDVLVSALSSCLESSRRHSFGDVGGAPHLRPYRLLISLLDKPEIGQVILDDILLDVFRALHVECFLHCGPDGQFKEDRGHKAEIFKTANLLFGTLEPHYIWDYLGQHFQECANVGSMSNSDVGIVRPVGSGKTSILELCCLTEFMLELISVETYVEMQVEHLPLLLSRLARILSSHCKCLSVTEITQMLMLCAKLLSKIQLPIGPVANSSWTLSAKMESASGTSDSKPSGMQAYFNELLDATGNGVSENGENAIESIEEDEMATTTATSSSHSVVLLRACISSFQDCFVRLCAAHLFTTDLVLQDAIECLLVPKTEGQNERRMRLENLLWNVLRENVINLDEDTSFSRETKLESVSNRSSESAEVHLSSDAMNFIDAFRLCCQILVDFSSLPTCFAVGGCRPLRRCVSNCGDGDANLPEWLRLLIVVACFVQNVDFQLIAIGTVLELIGLAHSALKTTGMTSNGEQSRCAGKGTFSVVIDPMLETRHLEIINTQTLFTHTVAHILWNQIGVCEAGCLQRCVELIHQLHNLASDSSTVEDVIGESMACGDEKRRVQSVRKFAVLWHVTRDLPPRSPSPGRERLLDRPLLIMLDCLTGTSTPHQGTQRSEVFSWLTHSIQRGDIGPILEPLLIILLHPDTARVSVQHVSVQSHSRHRTAVTTSAPNLSEGRQDQMDDASESKIYAISSVEGQVIYHVAGNGLFSGINGVGSWPTTALTTSTTSLASKPVFALSSIEPEGNSRGDRVVTSNANLSDFDLPSICERNSLTSDPICVFVNPFVDTNSTATNLDAGEPSRPNVADLSQAHRIDVAALRLSSSSDEFADDPTMSDAVTSVLDEILDGVFSGDEDSSLAFKIQNPECTENASLPHRPAPPPPTPPPPPPSRTEAKVERDVSIHPLHTYMLLYTQCYDSRRVLYALSTLKGIVQSNSRVAVCAMTTTGVSSPRCRRQPLLYELLARHRRSIFGRGFLGEVGGDVTTGFRSSMYLEVVITVCLYYMRAFYPNLAHMHLTDEDRADNWEVQLLAVELLTVLFTEVAAVVRDSGKGFASYITNLLAKCKVQKAVLHCVLSGIQRIDPADCSFESPETFTEAIIRFNEAARLTEPDRGCDFQETFQIGALRLLLVLVILEDQLANHKVDLETKVDDPTASRTGTPTPQQTSLRYHTGVLIPCQPLFQTALRTALGQSHSSPLHRHWLGLVSCLLPFMRKALANTVVSTVSQLCSNLESLARLYCLDSGFTKSCNRSSTVSDAPVLEPDNTSFPVDHLVLQLEGLTTLVHYCLLDSSNLVSTVQFSAQPSSMAGGSLNGSMTNGLVSAGPNATQIISNLINVFAPSVVRGRDASSSATSSPARFDPLTIARHNVLSLLPRLVSSLATLWMAVSSSSSSADLDFAGGLARGGSRWGTKQQQHQQQVASWVMGMPKVVRKHILELLCPLSLHHGVNFLASVALAWNDKRNGGGRGQLQQPPSLQQSIAKRVIPTCSPEQLSLVELVRAIKVMPMETVIQLVRQVVKQPPVSPASTDKKRGKVAPIEVLVLQFFHAYVQCSPGVHLVESWHSLQALLRDCLQASQFGPPALFYLLGILNEFVQRAPPLEDRKDQKDLQDLTQKLIETCGSVAGASLENTTWLRRNLAVKPGPQTDISELDTCNGGRRSGSVSPVELRGSNYEEHRWASEGNLAEMATKACGGVSSNYSVQALSMLAEMLAPLLDVVYHSEEKERVLPLLAALMYNVTPYLRTHGAHNMPSFRACSQLLASVSGYQYTRRAWRRDVFDLLLDPAFFQMEQGCLRAWRTTVDNLMTHDKTTFLDLMARVSIAQSGSLNLFSSKEQEYEQRAQLLKRLAFVVFCSEVDQYQSYMPEIQERLAESMRLPQVPNVQAQVFLCFRVLLLRMLPQHITSLWPIIITEMVQVFLLVEQELCKNSEEFSSHLRRLSTLETSWVAGGNELNAHNHPAWLQLYLAVCKLLDLCLCLPADALPQFQMYSWAFIGRTGVESNSTRNHHTSADGFAPHVVRLARLMSTKESCFKLPYQPGTPLLTMRQVRTLYDLQPFFETVSTLNGVNGEGGSGEAMSERSQNRKCDRTESVAAIERQLELDFLEPLPTSP